MITLRLFRRADPFREIESRSLASGELTIGRDPAAQWRIADPEREVSRQHCVISLRSDGVLVRDTSSNGVYLGNDRRRIERDEPTPVTTGETIHIGQYMIVMEAPAPAANDAAPAQASDALDAPFHRPMLESSSANSETVSLPSQWMDGDAPPRAASAPATDAGLLDAFCLGAQIDASYFAGEDPVDVMRRVGAVYQQLVLGLGDLMSERSSLKAEYRMNRTTVSANGNNPFKWAATQRVAVDLLRARDDGFLFGPAALKASFVDLKKHLLCLMAGSRAAVGAALDHLGPPQVEESIKGQSLLFMHKTEACWRAYLKRHEGLQAEAETNPDGLVNRAFRCGYEQELRRLDELGTRA